MLKKNTKHPKAMPALVATTASNRVPALNFSNRIISALTDPPIKRHAAPSFVMNESPVKTLPMLFGLKNTINANETANASTVEMLAPIIQALTKIPHKSENAAFEKRFMLCKIEL